MQIEDPNASLQYKRVKDSGRSQFWSHFKRFKIKIQLPYWGMKVDCKEFQQLHIASQSKLKFLNLPIYVLGHATWNFKTSKKLHIIMIMEPLSTQGVEIELYEQWFPRCNKSSKGCI